VEPPAVGYLPDMFGHISQTPQLLRGFGINNAILWRGISGDDLRSEFRWLSPDGSEVLTHHLPEYCGYCNGAFFYSAFPPEARTRRPEPHYWAMVTDDTSFVVAGLQAAIKRALDKSTTGVLLLMNGIDHIEPSPRVPAILDALRAAEPDLDIRHGSFEDFVTALCQAVRPAELRSVSGELRNTATAKGSYTFVLPNCLSARIHLKQANSRAQTLLERWAEPLDTLANALDGTADSRDFLDEAWKHLILNHPHDSICGCSVDPVHRQMMSRFEQSTEIAAILAQTALHRLSARVDTSTLGTDELLLTVFNPHNWPVTDTVPLDVEIEQDWLTSRGVAVTPDNYWSVFRDVVLRDPAGQVVPHTVLDIHAALVHRPWIEHFVPNRAVLRVRLALAVSSIPGLGYTSYALSLPAKPRRLPNRAGLDSPTELDNGIIWASIAPDGTLTIGRHDDPRPAALTGLHWFEDGGDNGDSYTYSPPRQDRIVTSLPAPARMEVLHHNPGYRAVALEWDLDLPESLTADRQHRSAATRRHTVRSVFSLGWSMHRLDIETTVTNQSRDHRLQVCFQTKAIGEDSGQGTDSLSRLHTAAMPFHWIERPNAVRQPTEEQWIEDEPLERPCHGWVRCGDLAVLTDGLPEYEIVPRHGNPVLKITLMRAVNYLAAGTHGNTILFGAGPHMETPDQQELGRQYRFRYAIMPLPPASANKLNWMVATQAAQHQAQWRALTLPSLAGTDPASAALGTVPAVPGSAGSLPRSAELLHLSGSGILLSALKPGPRPHTAVVRFWNSTDHPTVAVLRWLAGPHHRAAICNLSEVEQPEGVLEARDGAYHIPVGPWQVVSVLIELGENRSEVVGA
jgi:hypothetical protein